jgi:hypothetical protein
MLAVVGVLSAAAGEAQQPKSIGRVTALEGQVTVLRHGKFASEPLTLQAPVFQDDIIETERGSKVKMALSDATVISLGEQSRLELRQFSHDARQRTRSGRLAIAWGLFRVMLRELTSPSSMEVITPTAVAAIRGTDLMGEVSADSTAIVVLDGSVVISNTRPLYRGFSTLTPGMGSTVKADAPPSTPTQWSASRVEALRKATALP